MGIFAIDLDGTLLTDDHRITEINKQAIQLAVARGNTIVIATGRSVHSATEHLKMLDVDGYVVALNGAVVLRSEDNTVLFKKPLSQDGAKAMLEIGKQFAANVSICCFGETYRVDFTGKVQNLIQEFKPGQTPFLMSTHEQARDIIRQETILKIGIMHEDTEILKEMKSLLIKRGYPAISSDTHYIELMADGVNKGKGTKVIAVELGVAEKNIIVFGDQENDLELFAVSGLSFAPGNAKTSVQSIADYVVETNNNSGVGKTIMRLLDSSEAYREISITNKKEAEK